MKPKLLANVLIKVLGISICAHGVVALVNNVIYTTGRIYPNVMLFQIIVWLAPFAVGIFLIVRSRWLTDKLFKDEEE